MAVAWMWGWELGTTPLMYQNGGWTVTGNVDVAFNDPFQPAGGFGGGRFTLLCRDQVFNNGGRVFTPTSGDNAIPVHTSGILHTGYKRVGNTAQDEGGALLKWMTSGGTVQVMSLRHTATTSAISPIGLYVNGTLLGTSTTTYTDTQPYHRIVIVYDGAAGDYDVYIDGVLEISVSGSPETFANVDAFQFWGGQRGIFGSGPTQSGGRHDHIVYFDDTVGDLAQALGEIFIQGLLPNADSIDGSWLNVNGPNDGTNTDLHANIDDGQNLTDFIETTTTPDAVEVAHEDRADIDPGWAPSNVLYVQALQIARASGAISSGQVTIDSAGIAKHTSAAKTLGAAGVIVNELIAWTGNATTDLDDLRTGLEV